MFKFRKTALTVCTLVLTVLVLAACGSTATSTSLGTTSGAVTTASGAVGTITATTSGGAATNTTAGTSTTPMTGMTTAGTSATTTSAATTPAMTSGTGTTTPMAGTTTPAAVSTAQAGSTNGTSMMSPTAAMTSGTGMTTPMAGTVGTNTNLPAVTGATQVSLDQTVVSSVNQQLQTYGLNANAINFYTSDDATATLTSNANTAITSNGYKFAVPALSAPLTLPGTQLSVGYYTKSGAPDLLVLTAPVPANPNQLGQSLGLPSLSQSTEQQIYSSLQGHKSMMMVLSGSNLQQGVINLIKKYSPSFGLAG